MIRIYLLKICLFCSVIFITLSSTAQSNNSVKMAFALYPSAIYDDYSFNIEGYIAGDNGELKKAQNYLSTDFIQITDYDIVEYTLPYSSNSGITFYDSTKKYISSVSSIHGGIVKVNKPPKAIYARFSRRTDTGSGSLVKLYVQRSSDYDDPSVNEYIQSAKSSLYASYSPNYVSVFHKRDFAYNSVDRNGYGFLDPKKAEIFYPIFRIPVHIKTKHGTILIATEVRREQTGLEGTAIAIARSTDGGKTFSKRYICKDGNPNLIYDEINDRIFFMHRLTYSISTDDGNSWSDFKDLGLNIPQGWDNMYCSPTEGLQLQNGILVTPYLLLKGYGKNTVSNTCALVYSKDFGNSWNISVCTPDNIIANETTIAEYLPNQIMINARGGTEVWWGSENPGRRVFVPNNSLSNDRNKWKVDKWILHSSDKSLIEPICNASFISCVYGKYRFGLFCNPNVKVNNRKNLTLQVSSDFCHWSKVGLLTPHEKVVYGYCSLNYMNESLSFVYEDIDDGILFADITSYMDEILQKMIFNKLIYQ